MRWTPGRRSNQLEDRRGERAGGGGRSSGSGPALLSFLFRRFGIPGVVVGGAALYFFGGGLGALTGGAPGGAGLSADANATAVASSPEEEKSVQFVSFVLDDVQDTWLKQFTGQQPYRLAKMVIFRDETRSACGQGEAAMGPFYCPGDEKVYLDLSFFEDLSRRLGAPGDFAQAYVIGHEIGHHLQNIQGTSSRVHRAPKSEQSGPLGLSVRLELQADCYSGVWAHSAQSRHLLETGDLEEALTAASKIGDDSLQKSATGRVRPETFTHGSSEQRARWFRRGFMQGNMSVCDTFAAETL